MAMSRSNRVYQPTAKTNQYSWSSGTSYFVLSFENKENSSLTKKMKRKKERAYFAKI